MGLGERRQDRTSRRVLETLDLCDKGYVSETKSGIVVKLGGYEALAKAILYLRENRDVAEKPGASGREYVENNFSIERR